MKFRKSVGTLADSLKTTVTFETLEQFFEYLHKEYKQLTFKDSEIQIEHYRYDRRCNWNCYLVSIGNKYIGMAHFENHELIKYEKLFDILSEEQTNYLLIEQEALRQ